MIGWVVFERIGGFLAYLFARLRIPPSLVTVFGGASGIWGAARWAVSHDAKQVLVSAALLLLSYSLDCADGQLARATGRVSASGAWLDVAVDSMVIAFMTSALTVALTDGTHRSIPSLLLAGAYGASRIVSLMTAAQIRSSGSGGLVLHGRIAVVRMVYVALTDTPVTYVALCLSRLVPQVLASMLIVLTLMTALQTAVSVRRFLAAGERGAT